MRRFTFLRIRFFSFPGSCSLAAIQPGRLLISLQSSLCRRVLIYSLSVLLSPTFCLKRVQMSIRLRGWALNCHLISLIQSLNRLPCCHCLFLFFFDSVSFLASSSSSGFSGNVNVCERLHPSWCAQKQDVQYLPEVWFNIKSVCCCCCCCMNAVHSNWNHHTLF